MKLLPSPVAASVAALVLFLMASMPADAARDAENVLVPRDPSSSSNLLDGKTFVAQSGEKGKKASNKDTFVFRNGRFLSEGCNPWGFGDAPYRATDDGAAIRFHAETRSPTHGTMVWDGIVRGDAIEATNLWTRDRWYWKIKREYWYKGQLKK
jgi:hypothetical protein